LSRAGVAAPGRSIADATDELAMSIVFVLQTTVSRGAACKMDAQIAHGAHHREDVYFADPGQITRTPARRGGQSG
jgi:hypothetical protein